MPSKLPAASGGMFVRSRLSRRLTERRKRTKQYVMSIFMQKLRSTVPLRGRRLTVGNNLKKQRNFVNSGEMVKAATVNIHHNVQGRVLGLCQFET